MTEVIKSSYSKRHMPETTDIKEPSGRAFLSADQIVNVKAGLKPGRSKKNSSSSNYVPEGGKAFRTAEELVDPRMRKALEIEERTNGDMNYTAKKSELKELHWLNTQRAKSEHARLTQEPKPEPKGGKAFLDAVQVLNEESGKNAGRGWKPAESDAKEPSFPIAGVEPGQVNAFTSRADVMTEHLGAELVKEEIRKSEAESKRLDELLQAVDDGKLNLDELDAKSVGQLWYHMKDDRSAFYPKFLKKQIGDRLQQIRNEQVPALVNLGNAQPEAILSPVTDPASAPTPKPVSRQTNFNPFAANPFGRPDASPVDVLPTVDEMPNLPIVHPELVPSEADQRSAEGMLARARQRRENVAAVKNPIGDVSSTEDTQKMRAMPRDVFVDPNPALVDIPAWTAASGKPPLTDVSKLTPLGMHKTMENGADIKKPEQRSNRVRNRVIAGAGLAILACIGIGTAIDRISSDPVARDITTRFSDWVNGLTSSFSRGQNESERSSSKAGSTKGKPLNVAVENNVVNSRNVVLAGGTELEQLKPTDNDLSVLPVGDETQYGSEPETPETSGFTGKYTIQEGDTIWGLDFSKIIPNYQEWDQPGNNGVTKHDLMAGWFASLRDIRTNYATLRPGEVISYYGLSAKERELFDKIAASESMEDYLRNVRPVARETVRELSVAANP